MEETVEDFYKYLWKKLLYWMGHSRLKPIIAVYRMIKTHL